MLFGTKQKLANASFKIQLHGSAIDRVRNFCHLGVILDEYLSWKEHVSKVYTKVNKCLGLLGRIRSCLTLKAAKCIYNCLVLPVLYYTDTAWGELSVECKSHSHFWQQNFGICYLRVLETPKIFLLLHIF